jgi:hypothetical protein
MKIFGKWFLGIFILVLVAFAANNIFWIIFVYHYFSPDDTLCFDQTKVISENKLGDKVEYRQAICDGIAYSATDDLNLISARMNKKTTFLSYEQGDADPVVSWEGDHVLVVGIPNVAAINHKVDSAGDINIRYKNR